MTLAKPVLRGMYAQKIKIHLFGATACSIGVGLLWKFLYMEPRKRDNEAYWKYYDAEIHEKIMIDNGLLQSVPK